MNPRISLTSLWLLGCAAILLLAACSSSPKSTDGEPKRTVLLDESDAVLVDQPAPRRSNVLLTESDDARIGREASRSVAAEMGLLEDPALDAYLQGIGNKLLRGMPRRSFQYQFAVVDQVEPNAFALPGGYIFISRGLLALVNNEDELANVVGHEIVHAARRHAAAQQGIARSLSPLTMPWTRAAELAAYGRNMEREADHGGQILAAAAGYDPRAMSTFLTNLEQRQRLLIGPTRLPSFFDTHPSSQERAAANAVRASEIRWKRDPALGDPRASLLDHVDGLALGPRPEGGVFQGDRFLHPDLDFQLRFPAGWRTSNSNRAVGAASPRGDAIVFLTADLPPGDPRAVAEGFLRENQENVRLSLRESQPVRVGGLDAWRIQAEVSGQGGVRVAWVTFIPYGEATWRITGVSPASSAGNYAGRILNTVRSFRPLTEEQRKSIRATRLRVVTARSGEDLAGLCQRTDNSWDPARTAIANGVPVNHQFEGGELVKIARIEPYVSSSR